MAENVSTENSDKEFEEPPDTKVEDVPENVETKKYSRKNYKFSEGPLG